MSLLPEGGTTPNGGLDGLWIWVIRRAIMDVQNGNGHSQEARQWLLEDDGWHEVSDLSPEAVQRIRDFVAST